MKTRCLSNTAEIAGSTKLNKDEDTSTKTWVPCGPINHNYLRMGKRFILIVLSVILLTVTVTAQKKRARHTFMLDNNEFVLDGSPFQIIGGEMHPARIPSEYWQHRIRMTKAMGCNTISAMIFWNYHEQEEGNFDFETGNHNLKEFFRIVLEEEMWLLIRPGPHLSADWELGGIPPFLLEPSDVRLRCSDPFFMSAAERYMKRLAEELKPWLVTSGGPILMLQIENEYGKYGNDRDYMAKLKEIWMDCGIDVPFYTADDPIINMLEAGSLAGCAIGLNPGRDFSDFDLVKSLNMNVPVFSSETLTGRFTHWGEKWTSSDTVELLKEVKFLMDNKKSFNLYVVHGGTNFGFTAGADSKNKDYKPVLTSYDFNAPVDEQGSVTPKYMSLRKLIGSYLPKGKKLPEIPAPMPVFDIPVIGLGIFTSIWDNLPEASFTLFPKTFESFGQDYGFMLYKTKLANNKGGTLTVTDVHDFATVFINGTFIGELDRLQGVNSVVVPESDVENPVLEIFVEAMGRINLSGHVIDKKGITDRVTLNGTILTDWEIFNFPMDDKFIYGLRSSGKTRGKRGIFFKSNFFIGPPSDTFLDMSNFKKGIAWVNGHNLGRFWIKGPQKRLFCPASWLREGSNEIIVFDLLQTAPAIVVGTKTME